MRNCCASRKINRKKCSRASTSRSVAPDERWKFEINRRNILHSTKAKTEATNNLLLTASELMGNLNNNNIYSMCLYMAARCHRYIALCVVLIAAASIQYAFNWTLSDVSSERLAQPYWRIGRACRWPNGFFIETRFPIIIIVIVCICARTNREKWNYVFFLVGGIVLMN